MKNVMLEELYIISINILLLPLADVINAAERIYLCTYSLSQIILSTLLSYSAYFPSTGVSTSLQLIFALKTYR